MSTATWPDDARVLVTGADGFLGRRVVRALKKRGATVLSATHSEDPGVGFDLLHRDHARVLVENATRGGPLHYVFHLAGYNGGIEFNRLYPADVFHDNTVMALNLIHALAYSNHNGGQATKLVSAVASCAYNPPDGVCNEEDFLDGRPDPSVACHGYAKRNVQLASQFYRRQYGLHAVCVCPPTLYGPGDTFDPARTKLMGAMVRRFVKAARENPLEVEVWGTGEPRREFMYVADAAELIVRAAAHDDSELPLNLPSGQEVSVRELAELVAHVAGYRGKIRFDWSRPDGQLRKRLNPARALPLVEGYEFLPLEAGVRRTVAWYEKNYPEESSK